MPAAGEVVLQRTVYYAFAFNLDVAGPRVECAPDFTVVSGRTVVVFRGLNRAPGGRPDQSKYKDRDDVDPFDSQG